MIAVLQIPTPAMSPQTAGAGPAMASPEDATNAGFWDVFNALASANPSAVLQDPDQALKSGQPDQPEELAQTASVEIVPDASAVIGAMWQPFSLITAKLSPSESVDVAFPEPVTPTSKQIVALPPTEAADAAPPSIAKTDAPLKPAPLLETAVAALSPPPDEIRAIPTPIAPPAPAPFLQRLDLRDTDQPAPGQNTAPLAQKAAAPFPPVSGQTTLAEVPGLPSANSTAPTISPSHSTEPITAEGGEIIVFARPAPQASTAEVAFLQKWGGVQTSGLETVESLPTLPTPQDSENSLGTITAALVPLATEISAPAMPPNTLGAKRGKSADDPVLPPSQGTSLSAIALPDQSAASGKVNAMGSTIVAETTADLLPQTSTDTASVPALITLSAQIASPAAQSTTAPAMPPAVAPIIIEMAKTGNDGPLEIALAPEELGRLTISIKQDGDFVRVTLVADRPETLDLMRRHSADLISDLRQAGFSGASLSFGQGGQGQQSRFATPDQTPKQQPQPQHHAHTERKPTAPSRARKGSGIDMRF